MIDVKYLMIVKYLLSKQHILGGQPNYKTFYPRFKDHLIAESWVAFEVNIQP